MHHGSILLCALPPCAPVRGASRRRVRRNHAGSPEPSGDFTPFRRPRYGAAASPQKLATFAIDGEITFRTAADRAAFAEDLGVAVTRLVDQDHHGGAGGRKQRLVVALHPALKPETQDSTKTIPAKAGFVRLKKALGVENASQGESFDVEVDGVGRLSGQVDFSNENFLGLRTADTMYRFFGRNSFGAPVGMTVHDFSGSGDSAATARAWGAFLEEVYA
ncbi:hypothetical protein QFZ23_000920 [Arthrobacter globiformis]|uniref:hypothetical protein n=1 Tax=Arthrobacter globiformis TaxID=1665 RepID=UPI00278A84F4|nr:hypothetical protein [Arthrobacter globiformis]MDQ1057019.1 hypothetical protein [Arthrobacter globiformis]